MEVDVQSGNIPGDLPDDYKICIYRIAQEALNNATRHSGAKRARVELDWDGQTITVSISDDGQGFDSERVRGLGLLGMEERVRRLGGKVTIHSRPREGTNIRVELPVSSTVTAKQHAETSNTPRR